MNTLRTIMLSLIALLFGAVLISFTASLATSSVISDKDNTAETLKESGLYNNLTDVAIDLADERLSGQVPGLSLQDTPLRQIATNVFASEKAQDTANTVFIQSLYRWLESESENLSFELNFEPQVEEFAKEAGDYAKQRADQLPQCRSFEELSANRNASALNLTCLPPGIDTETARENLVQRITDNKSLLNVSFNEDELRKQGVDMETLETVRTSYQQSMQLPWILGITAAVLAVLVFILAPNARRAVRGVFAPVFLLTGVLVLIASWATRTFVVQPAMANQQTEQTMSATADTSLLTFTYLLALDILGVLIMISAAYIFVSFVSLVLLRKRRS
jgi:hypothetical protein